MSHRRKFPDFIIVGAQKSGTTSLYNYLIQHPQIRPSFVKEVHYFDGGLNPKVDTYKKGPSWYRAHFPVQGNGNGFVAGEASPIYMFNPLVPKRIYELLPEVKLIALLRSPVERAISHYFHEKRKGREKLPILEAFEREEERLKPVFEKQDYKNEIFKNKSYKNRGLYIDQLERFTEYFSKEQFLVLSSEELFTSPDIVLSDVFNFLEVKSDAGIKKYVITCKITSTDPIKSCLNI